MHIHEIKNWNLRTQLSWSLCLSSRMDCSLGPSLVSNACTAFLVFSNCVSLMITLANCRYLARVCSRLGTGSLGSSAPCVKGKMWFSHSTLSRNFCAERRGSHYKFRNPPTRINSRCLWRKSNEESRWDARRKVFSEYILARKGVRGRWWNEKQEEYFEERCSLFSVLEPTD